MPAALTTLQCFKCGLFVALLSAGLQILGSPPHSRADEESATAKRESIDLELLLDEYRTRESKIHSLDLQWKEVVVERKADGAYDRYPRIWKVLLKGDKVRTEESGVPSSGTLGGKIASISFINAFNGEVGKRLTKSNVPYNSIGIIDNKDGAQMLKVNNLNLNPILMALRPTVVLTSRDNFRTPWTTKIGQLDGKQAFVLIRKAGKDGYQVEELYIDPSDLTIKRATSGNQNSLMQCDIEYRDVEGAAEPVRWKWSNSERNGNLLFSRTIRDVQVKINPEIAPSEFDLDFPIGTHVSDKRINQMYLVGPNAEKHYFSIEDMERGATYDDILNGRLPKPRARPKTQIELAQEAVKNQAPPALDITTWLNTEDGLELDKLKGKVVLLDFWGTWCLHCIKAIPDVQKFAERNAERGVVVIGVHSVNDAETCREFLEKNGVTFPVAIDSGKTAKRYAVYSWPSIFLIDKQGKFVMSFTEELPDDNLIEKLLRE